MCRRQSARGLLQSRGIEHHGDIGSILWMCKTRRPCGSGNRQKRLAPDPFPVVTRERAKRSAATTSPHYFLDDEIACKEISCPWRKTQGPLRGQALLLQFCVMYKIVARRRTVGAGLAR